MAAHEVNIYKFSAWPHTKFWYGKPSSHWHVNLCHWHLQK